MASKGKGRKSAYVLEASVAPGGSRWAEFHVYTELAHIEACLRRLCENKSAEAYHAIWYGAELWIHVVQRGEAVFRLDLHEHMFAKLGERGPHRLDESEALTKMITQTLADEGAIDEGELGEDGEALSIEELDDWEIFDRIELFADWPSIAARLPTLEPPLLQPGERTWNDLRFGSEDIEAGALLDPPPGVDVGERDEDFDVFDGDDNDDG